MSTATEILGSHQNIKIPAKWSNYYQRLCAERERLLARDCSIPQTSRTDIADLADAATEDFQRSLSVAASSATQHTIFEVIAAIRRIERGTYGCCELTGEPIEAERLQAIPWTRYSLSGQSEMERSGRMRRHALPRLESADEPAPIESDGSGVQEPNQDGNGSAD